MPEEYGDLWQPSPTSALGRTVQLTRAEPPRAPSFAHYLARELRATVIADTPGPGAVPVLDSLIQAQGETTA